MDKKLEPLTSSPRKLLFSYGIASVLALFSGSLSILIDGIFLGRWVGPHALAALSYIGPVISIFFSIGLMVCIGGSISVGKYLGEKDTTGASHIFSSTLIAVSVMGILVISALYIEISWIFFVVGAPKEVLGSISQFLDIYLPFTFIELICVTLYFFTKMDKQPRLAMIAVVGAAITNILFDSFFIIIMGLGIEGAAWATSLSAVVKLLILLSYFFNPERQLRLIWPGAYWREFFRSCLNGFPVFVNMISGSILSLLINFIIVKDLGSIALAAYASVNYLLMFGLNFSAGFSDAMQVLVSHNYGAKNTLRINMLRKITLLFNGSWSLIVIVFVLLLPNVLLGLFVEPQHVSEQRMAESIVKLMWPLFLSISINMAVIGYFAAIQQTFYSSLLVALRAFILPCIFLLCFQWLIPGEKALIGLPLADMIAMLLGLWWVRKVPISNPNANANNKAMTPA